MIISKFIVRSPYIRKMSSFVASLNHLTGKMEWKIPDTEYDYKQEIARSSYADMLHDDERNKKYFEGIKNSIKYLRENGKEVHVLDIGTGTGLLSMMALSCGVDSITACEAFTPMYKCANQILMDNNYRHKINLVGKRSTDMEFGVDMKEKANLLVAEVFDTELIGEGAIQTFLHAKENLLTEDALVVPMSAVMYVQIVHSPYLKSWNTLADLEYPSASGPKKLKIPSEVQKCIGSCLNDVQVSEIPKNLFQAMSDPIPIFSFDWTGKDPPLKKSEKSVCSFVSKAEKSCDAVFIWWDLNMDIYGQNILSCAPYWAHPLTKDKENGSSEDIPWRDHWMQAVYFLPSKVNASKNEELQITSYHDEYSLWFNIEREKQKSPIESPMCTCGLHLSASRARIAQLNDRKKINFFASVIEENVNENSVCLFLGELPLHAIYAAKLGAKHVYITKPEFDEKLLCSIIEENELCDKITMLQDIHSVTESDLCSPITLVISEPYISHSMLPWHNLHLWYIQNSVRHLFSPDVNILPDTCTIKCIAADFRDLWKIRADVGVCCGFDISFFDKLISAASEEVDESVDGHSLWEYPCKALSQPVNVATFNLRDNIPSNKNSQVSHIDVSASESLNGLAFWCDWTFSNRVLSDGPVDDILVNKKVTWEPNTKQGVHLISSDKTKVKSVKVETVLDTCSMSVCFNIS